MERNRIKCIAFDFGGVVIHLSYEQAVRRFEEIGLKDARKHLDPFHQAGIFGALEEGRISAETFRSELSKLAGKELTMDECAYAWHGYAEAVPKKNLLALMALRKKGYRVCLLSNTNPFMMGWARSKDFDDEGHGIDFYFDRLYLSFECKVMKPASKIFELLLQGEEAKPEEVLFIDDSPTNCQAAEKLGIQTLCPQNNEDWTEMLMRRLNMD
ncbi:MAG: HAD family phosphatase [Bacteroidaceae bacterium]|nr:HAD family phosphatase [Bacteroidaceae bacterium]